MSDKAPPAPPPPSAPPMEGWNIRSRLVMAAMAAILAVLALALVLTEHRYRAKIEPTTHPKVHPFPSPRLDGFDMGAGAAPARPADAPPLSDAVLAKAAGQNAAGLQDAPK